MIYNTGDKAATQLEIFYNGCNTTSIIMKNVYEIIFCQRTSSQILLRTFYLHEHHILLKYIALEWPSWAGPTAASEVAKILISGNQLGCWRKSPEEETRRGEEMVGKCIPLFKKKKKRTNFIRMLLSLAVGWI